MASFTKGPGYRTPFGKNEFLRSTQDIKVGSGTYAAATHPEITVDSVATKVLQPGTVVARITSGTHVGKFGPFQAGVTDGRQTVANIVGIAQTFLPWQLTERDVEIGIIYEAAVIQAKCIEYDTDGDPIALTNTTRDAMVAKAGLDIRFVTI